MGQTLYVGNFGMQVTANELQDLFGSFGTVVSAEVVCDRETKRSKGFGFVEMGDAQSGQAAIANPDTRSCSL